MNNSQQEGYLDTCQVEFALIQEPFENVRPIVQELFRRSRRRRREAPVVSFSMRQEYLLLRHKSHQIRFFGEKEMRIIEPLGAKDRTILKTLMDGAFLRLLSSLMPKTEFIEFNSCIVNKRVQEHGLYVRRKGKIVRRAVASVGYYSKKWEWMEQGEPLEWENTESHSRRYISQRQNRETLANQMHSLGFDPIRYMDVGEANREARFRGS